ncbi:hypothetical protein BRD16_03265 [Halobacteriales archaeon SW_6_65_46]|nr:MAG: hypothetical protein BRD16_03265 [Halobacteriales archaeon SW_6_65_46]
MPVSIDEFESDELPSEQSVPSQVVAFLHSHANKAFTRGEIATEVDANPNAVGTALSRLKHRSLVRHRGNYWAITDDDERVQSAYDLAAATARLNAEDGGIDPGAWKEAAPDEPHPSERDD